MNFLPQEEAFNKQALHNIFTEMHAAYQKEKVPMSEEQTRYCMSIMLATDGAIESMYNDLRKAHWSYNEFFKRCEIFQIKLEKRLQVWIAALFTEFNIGGMILLAYYIQWYMKTQAPYEFYSISLDDACNIIFPFGVFTKKTIHTFWDKQKVSMRPDNLIDHPSAALSFMPTTNLEPIE